MKDILKGHKKQINKYISKEHENIFIFGFIIYIISVIISDYTMIGNYIPSYVFSIAKYFGILLVVLKIIFVDIKKYSSKEKNNLMFILGLILIISFKSQNRTILQYFLLIVGAKDIPFKKIVKSLIIIESVMFLILLILCWTGIIENRIIERTGEVVKRYSLGFKDCKYPAIIMWSITLLYIYIRNKDLKCYELAILLIMNIIIYKFTNSRNELLCSMIVIITVFGALKLENEKINKVVHYTAKYSMSMLFILFFVLTILYSLNLDGMYQINKILSGRLYLTNNALEQYGITLFGTHIKWVGLNSMYSGLVAKKDMNFVDCSYMKIMFEYGIVGLGILLYGYMKLFDIKKVKNNNIVSIVLLVINIHSFLDPQFFVLPFNIFLIMMNDIIFLEKEENMQENLMINTMSLEEIHNEEINMMKKFTEYCEKNNLTYYICGGTLLGAIRHKGFIPWDDDVDILMPRPDFTKFEELAFKDNLLIAENMEVHSFDLGNLNDPFCKIMNLNTIMDKHFIDDEYDKHLWLDVFPMDGLPENQKETEKIYKKVLFLRRIVVMLKAKDEIIKNESKSRFKAFVKPILRICLKPIGVKKIIKKINKICTKYDYNTSKYVGGIAWGYGPQEKLLKEKVQDEKIIFENVEVNTFACYDEYLKKLYGDYMKLPPKEKQVAHIMKVKKLKVENE